MIKLQIYGDPVPQGRPRAFRRGNFIGMYDPEKSRDWKNSIKLQAIAQKAPMLAGALSMTIQFMLKRPKTLPKKVIHHVKKPDVDNLVKAVKDALRGICYQDDSQIVTLKADKAYAAVCPGVLVEIRNIE